MPRRMAYLWLSKQLGLDYDKTHIGEFDVAMCHKVIDVVLTAKKVKV